jgi:hypothetical protein
MVPDELPSADTLLNLNDIGKYGSLALLHVLTDHWIPYRYIACIVYEADGFYEVTQHCDGVLETCIYG